MVSGFRRYCLNLKSWSLMMLRKLTMTFAATVAFAAAGLSGTAAQAAPSVVASPAGYAPGTIVVKTNERKLYLILGEGQALRYPVGVGKAGKQWAGSTRIDGKYRQPAWSPPADVKRDNPSIPDVIPGGSTAKPTGGVGEGPPPPRAIATPPHP